MSLASSILEGNIRASARLMRWADDRDPRAVQEIIKLHPHTGHAFIIGITGNPGSGKSTLVDATVRSFRARNLTVGVICVDPSSPYTGGAILGDRIRMQKHSGDPGVFIRSLATRGHLGGLSRSTNDVVTIMDAMGLDVVIVETVGVGQDEVDIVKTAHTSVVVLVPGLGDDIQSMKAGILEIADIFVVNKADRDGADRVVAELQYLQHLMSSSGHREIPILRTVAKKGEGIEELVDSMQDHRRFLAEGEGLMKREEARAEEAFRSIITERFMALVKQTTAAHPDLADVKGMLARRELDPYTAAEQILARTLSRLA